jgi:hypothetical protein
MAIQISDYSMSLAIDDRIVATARFGADHPARALLLAARMWSWRLACRDRLPCGSAVAGEFRPDCGIEGEPGGGSTSAACGVDRVEVTGTRWRGECWD